LRDPLGGALPFCIAAGGLRPEDVSPWLREGVDAIALGSQRLGWREQQERAESTEGDDAVAAATLRTLLAELAC
jgi:2-dehydro-3-deoxyphosphogluconate aldolase/(4S)-4-hydroxy-2-oxoglutarate aldolase